MTKELATERVSLADIFKIMTGEDIVKYQDEEEE